MRMRHIVNCGLSGSTILSHVISNGTIVGGKKVIQHEVRFDFLYNFCLKNLSL
jgi:hypothetical protein